jgi:ferredoxin
LKVRVDQERCVSSGSCVLAASEVFDQRDEDGVVVLLDPSPSAEKASQVLEAAAMCPALAITVDE